MRLRKYLPSDCCALAELFFDTVHTVNAKDYTQEQLEVWATGNVDTDAWNKSFLEHNTIVSECDGAITGFGDMDSSGYLDRLYIHKDYQGLGIAKAIVAELERQAAAFGVTEFTTYASITAREFFIKQGYHVVASNTVVRNGVELTNFLMQKKILY